MKNIHLLSTKSKTRLYLSNYGKEFNLASHPTTFFTTGQHIYITNDEEIKEGDWHLVWLRDKWEVLNYMPAIGYRKECLGKEVCKIILTTDQNLIKDGVQAIDDKFLEWFVKNPSCEGVQVEWLGTYTYGIVGYKIIIPKEETKQSIKDIILSETPESVKQKVREAANALVNKQETTLEEAKYNAYKEYWNENHTQEVKSNFLTAFKLGARWQQERSYSEEDLREAFKQSRQCKIFEKDMPPVHNEFEDWFEQFKKK